jgi:hypothetical protein
VDAVHCTVRWGDPLAILASVLQPFVYGWALAAYWDEIDDCQQHLGVVVSIREGTRCKHAVSLLCGVMSHLLYNGRGDHARWRGVTDYAVACGCAV